MTDSSKPSTRQVAVYCPQADELQAWVAQLNAALPANFEVSTQSNITTDYAVTWQAPAEFFERAPNLLACFGAAAGVDHLLTNPSIPVALPLFRLEDAGMGPQMAVYCRHAVEHYRLKHGQYQIQQAASQWQEHDVLPPSAVRIGIFGFGVLGQQVGRLLSGEGYPVSAYKRSALASTHLDVQLYSGVDQWATFLNRSQVLILVAPLTQDTRAIINQQALSQLPDGAYLINVGRGGLIDDEAVIAALGNGKLAGATLDVFNTEPLPASSPYWQLPGVRITPHVSAKTQVPDSARQIAEKILQLEAGGEPGGRVMRELGY